MSVENLLSDAHGISDKASQIDNRIEQELEKLHADRHEVTQKLNELQNELPRLKTAYVKVAKAFGSTYNELTKKDALTAKAALQEAVNTYRRLETALKEIEASITALEAKLETA